MTFSASVKTALRSLRKASARALGAFHRGLCSLWLLPVRLYRRFLSPLKGQGSCRFRPTCSQYAIDAVREWGILAGTLLALWRVVRCNPFSEGGEDPVPRRKDVAARLGFFPRAAKTGEPARPSHHPSTER